MIDGKITWLLTKKELGAWLDGIISNRILIAPKLNLNVILYSKVSESSQIIFTQTRPLLPVKETFFPQTERLFKIQKSKENVKLEETIPDTEMVIFAVRPCDARGIKLLDSAFLTSNPVDPYYAERRKKTIVIGLACKEPGPFCFCTSIGGNPDDASNMDIMITEKDNGYQIQVITEKGSKLISRVKWKESQEKFTIKARLDKFPIPHRDKWPVHFRDEFWARIGERCISCRACAYLCPTCRCFIIRDEVISKNEFERIRVWDSCMGENYRKVASGHKPRSNKGERQRNRFFCKFYYFPEQYNLSDTTSCTGCGRCIEVCPVGVDVTEVLTELER